MNKFYGIILVLLGFSVIFDTSLYARFVRCLTMVVNDELINNVEFSHTIKSDNGKSEEKFFVNRIPVAKDDFYKELEDAQLVEIRRDRERLERQKRARMNFVDQAQIAILEKLIIRLVATINRALEFLQHEQLKKYYVFDSYSVDSMDSLVKMRHYIEHKAQTDLQELSAIMDLQGLQKMLDKLEDWPERLESCFKDSVQNAIKQSDDTLALKELLTLVSS